MRIAVLTLTRDRLDYTKHCFASLRENAGCEFDHYIWDNGSTDGTTGWLAGEEEDDRLYCLVTSRENIGISNALNQLLTIVEREAEYDAIVRFDNDCEVVTPDTLHDIAELACDYGMLLAPQILGLRNPPQTIGRAPLSLGGVLVDEKTQIGGIFLAAPASLHNDGFRYNENNPVWGLDDVDVCSYWRARGGKIGYVQGYEAWHYEGTETQWARYPEYFARTMAEGKAVL